MAREARNVSNYAGTSLAASVTMGKPTVYADTLSRAAVAVGGETRLAGALQVSADELRRWLHGTAYPPTEIYQKALDLLIGIGSH